MTRVEQKTSNSGRRMEGSLMPRDGCKEIYNAKRRMGKSSMSREWWKDRKCREKEGMISNVKGQIEGSPMAREGRNDLQCQGMKNNLWCQEKDVRIIIAKAWVEGSVMQEGRKDLQCQGMKGRMERFCMSGDGKESLMPRDPEKFSNAKRRTEWYPVPRDEWKNLYSAKRRTEGSQCWRMDGKIYSAKGEIEGSPSSLCWRALESIYVCTSLRAPCTARARNWSGSWPSN